METHEKVAALRKLRKLTQAKVAESLGIRQQTYARIETGHTKNLSVAMLKNIADVLGSSVHILANETSELLTEDDILNIVEELLIAQTQNKVLKQTVATLTAQNLALQEQMAGLVKVTGVAKRIW